MYKISLTELNSLLLAISEKMPLFLPVEKDGKVSYQGYNEGTEYASAFLNTVRSPKDFFFPQVQPMASFRAVGKTLEVTEPELSHTPFALFGVRACDVASFGILDSVFLSSPKDPYYEKKRESAIIISAACTLPSETCFCSAFGIDYRLPGGDISTLTADGELYWQPLTEKGERLTDSLSELLTRVEGAEESDFSAGDAPLASKIDLSYWNNASEKELFSSPQWDELYKGCLGCGVCTYVCPTCQCYDIFDTQRGDDISRCRCWDSCMYSDFTKMAHGNPRKTQKERFRQRFMHKLKYYPENNGGTFACVGCGRCLKSCPQNMSIIKVIRRLTEGD